MKKTGLWKTGFVMMGMLLAIHMVQILLERYAYSEIVGTFILI